MERVDVERWRRLGAAERTLVALVTAGLTDEEIAQRTGETTQEVAERLGALFEKLRVGSRAQLVIQSALAGPPTDTGGVPARPAAWATKE